MTRGSLLNSPLVMQACIWAMMCIEFNRHAKCGIQNKQTTVMNACYFHFITGHHIGRKYIQVWWVLLQLWGGSSLWQGRNEDACKYLCWWNVLTAFFKNQKSLIVQNANNNGELDGLHAVLAKGRPFSHSPFIQFDLTSDKFNDHQPKPTLPKSLNSQ